MKKVSLFLFLILTGCNSSRSTVLNEIKISHEVCQSKAQTGVIKKAVDLVDCEAKPILQQSNLTGFSDNEALTNFYMEKYTLAEKIDQKKISLNQAEKVEQDINEKYSNIFTSKDDGGFYTYPGTLNNAMIFYGMVK